MTTPDQRGVWDDAWTGRRYPANDFAHRCLARCIPAAAGTLTVLDLGCGSGADALYFALHGHCVVATDFSRSAVAETMAAARRRRLARLAAVQVDHSRPPLPFADRRFDLVYSHLSVHYFSDAVTTTVFDELHRVMKPGAILCVKCKSVDDGLYGQGERLGEQIYCRKGHVRHFFSKEYMAEKLARFELVSLRRTSNRTASAYHGSRSAYVEAIARRLV